MTVTHELQAPLAAILGWARLLQTKPFDSSTAARALATIERNATIEAKLVKELLDVSSILSGKFQLQPQRVDLIPLTKEVTTKLRPTAEVKTIQLVETLPSPEAEAIVLGDPARLQQIIANLLENAIKFTPQGGQVNIRLECIDSTIGIAVTDTGIGIPDSARTLVFDEFRQVDGTVTRPFGGSGLGLALARRLAQLLHGDIRLVSSDAGSTFTLEVPVRRQET